ncbi:MAG: hypothetical protein A2W91_14890 [Bacteroidetes bacterium GWF2_38_335]|nr:MAG: hypothetical protein A2W91_14890 [Bacteroidetes bacterium GWF2_38_335]OFY78485.1 MAG: hypothetical protein A2281_16200 [Bacteroidetes bacterium RIFOXYA12_FULL_38_20]HBS88434.1 hypothetical protein [Bacteroidales bacterium]
MKPKNKDTRYYIDLDLKNMRIIKWDYDQRQGLAQTLSDPFHQRIFITKGQYNKIAGEGSESNK